MVLMLGWSYFWDGLKVIGFAVNPYTVTYVFSDPDAAVTNVTNQADSQ